MNEITDAELSKREVFVKSWLKEQSEILSCHSEGTSEHEIATQKLYAMKEVLESYSAGLNPDSPAIALNAAINANLAARLSTLIYTRQRKMEEKFDKAKYLLRNIIIGGVIGASIFLFVIPFFEV